MTAQRCPVCGGNGMVPHGFYKHIGPHSSTNAAPETCKGCQGTGIVWEPQPIEIEIHPYPDVKWIHTGNK